VVTALAAAPDRLSAAYAYCESLARSHYENFPVASRLVPPSMRPHIAAIYAFARTADDFADEPGRTDDERLRLLDEWHHRLVRNGERGAGVSGPDLIFAALGATIERKRLPVRLFEDLLSAFRQDVTTKRYESWASVLDYCRRSANPVGRLVLRVADVEDDRLDAASDAVCTALQLTNFWQDLAIDWSRGRLYVPLDDRDRAGAQDRDLDAAHMTDGWRQALRVVADRTRALFDAGRPVCGALAGRLGWELRLTWLGGVRVLDKLRDADFDVFRHRPALGAGDVPSLLWQAARWRR